MNVKYCLLKFALIFTICISTVNSSIALPTTIAGEIATTYNVTPGGAFQYSIPLRLPPGIKDMIPSLAITYNSQSGNGMLGIGWSLSGLSVITRGSQDIYHNLNLKSVDFNGDVYFLDGQRMFQDQSSGLYLTEVKNFAKIEHHSGDYFTVEYPNGMKYQYGNTTNSQMLARGKSDVLMWAVNRIEDANGNFITFDYYNSQSTGEYRITSIEYGQNYTPATGTQGVPVNINFFYTGRNDNNKIWVGGSHVLSTALLDDIQIDFSNTTHANRYHLTYDITDPDCKHSRLTKIEELCDWTASMPPINIVWGSTSDEPIVEPTSPYTNSNYGNQDLTAGDFNGDGFTDVIATNSNGGSLAEVFINNKNGGFIRDTFLLPIGTGNYLIGSTSMGQRTKLCFDYDGDGKDDFIATVAENVSTSTPNPMHTIWLYRGNGLASVFDPPVAIYYGVNTNSHNSNFNSLTRFTYGDYDGDGKSEIIVIEPYSFLNNNSVSEYDIYLVGDEYSSLSSANKIYHFSYGHIDGALTMDYNGDGKDEFLLNHIISGTTPSSICYELKLGYNSSTLKPYLIQSSGWPVNVLSTSTFPHTYLKNWTGDFNGDGKTDLLSWLTVSSHDWYLAYSDGIYPTFYHNPFVNVSTPLSTYLHQTMPALLGIGGVSYFTADFNGDGLTDILQLIETSTNSHSSYYHIFYSTGSGFEHRTGTIAVEASDNRLCLGDFNGDGQMDLLSSHGVFSMVYFQKDNACLQVSSIEHAGKTISVEYKSLLKDPNYVSAQLPVTNSYQYLTKIFPVKVVKNFTDHITVENNYKYEGLLLHKYGLGLRGFTKFTVENIAGQRTYQTYDLTSSRFPFLLETQLYDTFTNTPSSPFGQKTTYQQIEVDGGANGMSRIIIPNAEWTADYLTGKITHNTITTGATSSGTVFYEYGKIDSKEERIMDLNYGNNSLASTTFTYGSNWSANKGMPTKTTVYSEIDPNGLNGLTSVNDYTYYNNGDIETLITDKATPYERKTTYTYDVFGNVRKTEIDGVGGLPTITTKYGYSLCGKYKVSDTDAENYTTQYYYGTQPLNCWGNILEKTDKQQFVTQYYYDVLNRTLSISDFSYYSKKTPSAHLTTNISYDWAVSSTYASSLANAQLAVTTTNNDNDAFTQVITDKYGRTIRNVTNDYGTPTAIYEDFEYNNLGLLIEHKTPYKSSMPGSKTELTYSYDDYNRVKDQTSSHWGPQIHTDYDFVNGLLNTTVTNVPTGQFKTSVTCGSTLRSIDDNNVIVSYKYYGNGVTWKSTTNGLDVITNVDAQGRITDMSEPNAGATSYTYDALDRLKTETLPTNITYEYTYDKIGRVLTKKEVSASTVPYTYTYCSQSLATTSSSPWLAGLMTKETSPNGYSIEYTYDNLGQLSMKEEKGLFPNATNSIKTNYTYLNNGKLEKYIFPNDIQIIYDYNGYGAMYTASLSANASQWYNHLLWLGYGKDVNGEITAAYNCGRNSQPLYNITRDFDAHGYPTVRDVTRSGSWTLTPVVNTTYDFNTGTGNMTSRTDIRGNKEEFSYDTEFDRLTKVHYPTLPSILDLDMTYDNKGNILKKTDVSTNYSAAGSTGNYYNWRYTDYALRTVPYPASTIPAFEIPQNTLVTTYNPALRKIERVAEDLQNEVKFTYGPEDKRIKAEYNNIINPGSPTWIQSKYYGSNYELVEDAFGVTELYYVWGNNELIAILRQQTPLGSTTPNHGEIYFPVRDELGSITHLFDDVGSPGANNGLVEERSYDGWGRVRDPYTWVPYRSNNFPTTWLTDKGYTGHEHIRLGSWNNNIINMNGRLYDPLVGRMFSPDLFIANKNNSQDYNKYTYARNNPLKYTDPSGNIPAMFVSAAVGGSLNLLNQSLKGNVNTFGDGLKYFGAGALTGAITGAISFGFSGVGGGLSNSIISSSTIGFTSAYVGATTNAWAGGTSFQNGIAAGLIPGMNGAANGALSGAAIGLIRSFGVIGSYTIGTRGAPTKQELQDAANYNKALAYNNTEDKLNKEYLSRFPGPYHRHGLKTVNPLVPPNYGLDKDGNFVSPKGNVELGLTFGRTDGTSIQISPAAMNYLNSASSSYQFTEVLGHELIHSFHRWFFGLANYYNPYSEYAAYRYSAQVYFENGNFQGSNDLINQGNSEGTYNFEYSIHPYMK